MNRRTFGFVILNVLFDIAEFAGIFFLIKAISGNMILSLALSVLAAAIVILLEAIASASVKNAFSSDDEELKNKARIEGDFKKLSDSIEEKYGITGLSLVISKGDTLNTYGGYSPALNYKNMIAVADGSYADYSRGAIAHEAGHAVSGLTNYSLIIIRLTHLLSSLLKAGIISLMGAKKCKGLAKGLAYFLCIPYFVLLIPDLIAVIPFMRADERFANDFAVSLGYGEELRTFYRLICDSRSRFEEFFDLAHPSIYDILERIDEKMELSEEEKKVYNIGKSVYFVEEDEENPKDKVLFDYYLYKNENSRDGYYSFMLGMAYKDGNGISKDPEKAKAFFEESSSKGNVFAKAKLSEIAEESGDIENAYLYLRDYTSAVPTDRKSREHKDELEKEYYSVDYDCSILSPAGKTIRFPIFKARLVNGYFTWIISSDSENFNILKGRYSVESGIVRMTIENDNEDGLSFTSDENCERSRITFTGAIGKYTFVMSHVEE